MNCYFFYLVTGKHSVKLTKNYSHLIQNLSNTEDIIDSLISKEVLDPNDREEINSSGVQAKINRKLIDHIRREDEYQFFLEALKEDPTNARLASDLESTDVKQDDVDLLQTGQVISELMPNFNLYNIKSRYDCNEKNISPNTKGCVFEQILMHVTVLPFTIATPITYCKR